MWGTECLNTRFSAHLQGEVEKNAIKTCGIVGHQTVYTFLWVQFLFGKMYYLHLAALDRP